MDEIVNKLYGTTSAGRSISTIIPGANAAIQKLSDWIDELPPSLQLRAGTESDRARLILHMMYNQVMLMVS